MELDIGLIPGLLVLAEEGHYGRAAERMHFTASALTKRIQRLEQQVGVGLIERGPAGVLGLTAAGERFVAAAEPLIAQAAAARRSALGAQSLCTLRIGFPAGTDFHLRIDLPGLVGGVRRSYPEVRIAVQGVPFWQLTSSLTDHRIDLLCTIAPVRHRTVESFPLQVVSARIGVVGVRHPLADSEAVDVASFADQPMLFNPGAPEEWMNPFWLGDIRPASEARLVAIDAQDQSAVLRHTLMGRSVITTIATLTGSLGPQLRPLTLTNSPPVTFHIARRRGDQRGAVRALVAAFQALPHQELQSGATVVRPSHRETPG